MLQRPILLQALNSVDRRKKSPIQGDLGGHQQQTTFYKTIKRLNTMAIDFEAWETESQNIQPGSHPQDISKNFCSEPNFL